MTFLNVVFLLFQILSNEDWLPSIHTIHNYTILSKLPGSLYELENLDLLTYNSDVKKDYIQVQILTLYL